MKVGQLGEDIIYQYLCKMPTVKEIKDVRNDKEYQKKDIDYILVMNTGQERTVEIKTDSYISDNIFFETMSAKETNSIGCMYKTEAEWLLYYFLRTKELYILKMPDYRNWVDENISRFQKRKIGNWRRGQGKTYTSEGRLIPKQILESEFKNLKKEIID
ncbi:MAG: hypothetical protein RR370_02670 [Synergistaceae bacterium]